MKKARDIFMYTLGALIVMGTFLLIGMLVWIVLEHPETPLKDTLVLAVGNLLMAFGLVVGYYWGSSKGSADKNELLKPPEKP